MALMSRPMFLALVLMVLFLTSQTDWLEQTKTAPEPNLPNKPQQIHIERQLIKEQIILIQEKKIHMLNRLVKDLQHLLSTCRGNVSRNSSPDSSKLESEFEEQNDADVLSNTNDVDVR